MGESYLAKQEFLEDRDFSWGRFVTIPARDRPTDGRMDGQ